MPVHKLQINNIMRFIDPKIHGIIDYLIVIILFASPTFFEMTGLVMTFTYVLGAIHLLMTLMTDFSVGIFKVASFPVHGLIELAVGIVLIVLAYTLFNNDVTGKLFYIIFGTIVMLTWMVTNYTGQENTEIA